jgi:glycosyltransferase involved in cell wall biosynthesis
MTIDLCVVSFNTANLLDRLIGTLWDTTPKDEPIPWRLHIMDNGSTDDSKELIQRWVAYLPANTNVIYNTNVGYSAACNELASLGTGDLIGLLNSDIWFTNNDVKRIQNSFDTYPNIAILGPKQRDEAGMIRHAGIVGSNDAPKHRGWAVPDPKDELYRDSIQCVTVSGSAYFVRRNVWNEMTHHPEYQSVAPGAKGAFLPTPHYFEETWCSYFARHLGHEVWYDGSISIGHSWMGSTGGPDPKLGKLFRESQRIFRKAADKLGIEHD